MTPGWNGNPPAFPLGLHTPPLPATHARAGTGLTDTDQGLHLRHQSDLHWQVHSHPATSCRTALSTPGTAVPARPAGHPRPPHAALQRPVPVPPSSNPPPEASYHEASSRVHGRSPVRPSPRLWPPGVEREPSGLSPRASHPAVTGGACRGGDRHRGHLPELRHHQLVLHSTQPLTACDLVSH